MGAGIVSWGAYLPYWRLERNSIGAAFGTAPGKGSRAVASYDEDTTTLGVEAARRALEPEGVPVPEDVFFSTPDPAYLDKTNATTIHAALGLPTGSGAYDLCGSVRSSWAALRMAQLAGRQRPALAVLSDLRTGLAGGAEESQGGDGAVAFVFAPEGGVAEVLGTGSATDEYLDRWRVPGESASRQWEDRFGEEAQTPLAKRAFAEALAQAGVDAGRPRPPGGHRTARPRRRLDPPGPRGRTGTAGTGLRAPGGEPRGRPGRGGPGRRARTGNARPARRGDGGGRRRRRDGAAHHRGPDRRAGRPQGCRDPRLRRAGRRRDVTTSPTRSS